MSLACWIFKGDRPFWALRSKTNCAASLEIIDLYDQPVHLVIKIIPPVLPVCNKIKNLLNACTEFGMWNYLKSYSK